MKDQKKVEIKKSKDRKWRPQRILENKYYLWEIILREFLDSFVFFSIETKLGLFSDNV